jgi:small-conductance mechanosensitive channel
MTDIGQTLVSSINTGVYASMQGVSPETARTIALATRWAVNVFVILAVLNQLGVAADLVRILFTGFVAMVAIAGGIAFGLGGQGAAKDLVDGIAKKLK